MLRRVYAQHYSTAHFLDKQKEDCVAVESVAAVQHEPNFAIHPVQGLWQMGRTHLSVDRKWRDADSRNTLFFVEVVMSEDSDKDAASVRKEKFTALDAVTGVLAAVQNFARDHAADAYRVAVRAHHRHGVIELITSVFGLAVAVGLVCFGRSLIGDAKEVTFFTVGGGLSIVVGVLISAAAVFGALLDGDTWMAATDPEAALVWSILKRLNKTEQ